jgi:hypothetical protein
MSRYQQKKWPVATVFLEGEPHTGVYASIDDLAAFIAAGELLLDRDFLVESLRAIRDLNRRVAAESDELN